MRQLVKMHLKQILRMRYKQPSVPLQRWNVADHADPGAASFQISRGSKDRDTKTHQASVVFRIRVRSTRGEAEAVQAELLLGVKAEECQKLARSAGGTHEEFEMPGAPRSTFDHVDARYRSGVQEFIPATPAPSSTYSSKELTFTVPAVDLDMVRQRRVPVLLLLRRKEVQVNILNTRTEEQERNDNASGGLDLDVCQPVSDVIQQQQRCPGGAVVHSAMQASMWKIGPVPARVEDNSTTPVSLSLELVRQMVFEGGQGVELAPIYGFEGGEDDSECMICYERVKNSMLLPCRHCSACTTCLRSLREEKCPLCRTAFDKHVSFPTMKKRRRAARGGGTAEDGDEGRGIVEHQASSTLFTLIILFALQAQQLELRRKMATPPGGPAQNGLRVLIVDFYDSYTWNLVDLVHCLTGSPPACVQHDRLPFFHHHHVEDPDNDIFEKRGSCGSSAPAAAVAFLEAFDAVILSPGPGHPGEYLFPGNRRTTKAEDDGKHVPTPVVLLLEAAEAENVPVFGVCLGLQILCLRHGIPVEKVAPAHGLVDPIVLRRETPAKKQKGFAPTPPNEIQQLFDQTKNKDTINVVRYHSLAAKVSDAEAAGSCFDVLATTSDGELLMAAKVKQHPHYGVQFHPESILTDCGASTVANFLNLAQELRFSISKDRPTRRCVSCDYSREPDLQLDHLQKASSGRTSAAAPRLYVQKEALPRDFDVEDFFERVTAPGASRATSTTSAGNSFTWPRFWLDNARAGERCRNMADSGGGRSSIRQHDAQTVSTSGGCYSYLGGGRLAETVQELQLRGEHEPAREEYHVRYFREVVGRDCERSDDEPPLLGGRVEITTKDRVTGALTQQEIVLSSAGPGAAKGAGAAAAGTFLSWFSDYTSDRGDLLSPDEIVVVNEETSEQGNEDGSSDWMNEHTVAELPFDFRCGFVGYFGYGLRGETLPTCSYGAEQTTRQSESEDGSAYAFPPSSTSPAPSAFPDAYWCYVSTVVVLDHGEHEIYLLSLDRPLAKGTLKRMLRMNFTVDVDAPYGCYVEVPGGGEDKCRYILSSSPERFLKIDVDGWAEMKPIKGTARRDHEDACNDERLKTWLGTDAKNKAENLMIVDLVRNDLSHVCEPGTVHCPYLMHVESYQTVHQLVSTVRGKLKRHDVFSAVAATFPPGSMTGAPKKRSCELLEESLETVCERGPYSGGLGFLGLGHTCELSVVIRSLFLAPAPSRSIEKENKEEDDQDLSLTLHTGGAITVLSDACDEYDEMLLKGNVLNSVVRDVPTNTDRHLVYYKTSKSREIYDAAMRRAAAKQLADENERVVETKKYGSVLLHNTRGEVTELTFANVAVRVEANRMSEHVDGSGAKNKMKSYEWVTPPLRSGLLPGILRQKLLKYGLLRERVITVGDLRKRRSLTPGGVRGGGGPNSVIVGFNAVRGVFPVELDMD
eukprot:g6970.t1